MARSLNQHPDLRQPRLSPEKRTAILEAAGALFLANGYRGTSIDQIAASATVSKQTVYKHFADKESLFREIVRTTVDEVSDPVYQQLHDLTGEGDLDASLRRLARRQLTAVMQPRLLRLRRLVIGEVARFPELGATFYERGSERTVKALAEVFQRLAASGLLRLDDPLLAAERFNWLIMSAPMNRAMMCGDEGLPSTAELNRYADSGVEAFLSIYGPG